MTQSPDHAPMTTDVAAVAKGLTGAHRRLAMRIGNRWIKGTGICHGSVGRDLEAMGLVESRFAGRYGRQIRAMPLGLAVRAFLNDQGKGVGDG